MTKRTVPALPARLIDPRPVIGLGVFAWAVSLLTMLVIGYSGMALWTAVCGVVVGVAIYGVFAFQRNAVRRGSVTAQKSLPDVKRDGKDAMERVEVVRD